MQGVAISTGYHPIATQGRDGAQFGQLMRTRSRRYDDGLLIWQLGFKISIDNKTIPSPVVTARENKHALVSFRPFMQMNRGNEQSAKRCQKYMC